MVLRSTVFVVFVSGALQAQLRQGIAAPIPTGNFCPRRSPVSFLIRLLLWLLSAGGHQSLTAE